MRNFVSLYANRRLAMSSTPRVKPSPVRRRWHEVPDEVKCQPCTTRKTVGFPNAKLVSLCFAFGRPSFVVQQKKAKVNQGCPLNPARAIWRQALRPKQPASAHSAYLPEPRGRKAPVGALCAKRTAFCSLGYPLVSLRLSRLIAAPRTLKLFAQFMPLLHNHTRCKILLVQELIHLRTPIPALCIKKQPVTTRY